mmetsp:Transcript_32337/g.65574  ORF Transcript_32337/g.65574 Transcript_32337/m.65574 type:complete len:212 (+) Transcript_32337:1-636(+)
MKQQHGDMEATLRACDVEAVVETSVVTISVQDFLGVFYNNLEGSQAAIIAVLQLEPLACKNRENIKRIQEGVLKRRTSAEPSGGGWCDVSVGASAKDSWERIRSLRLAAEEKKKTSRKDRVLRELSVLAGIYCHLNVFGGERDADHRDQGTGVIGIDGPGGGRGNLKHKLSLADGPGASGHSGLSTCKDTVPASHSSSCSRGRSPEASIHG